MKKMMPGIRAVCKNPVFVQSELSVPPWQHSPAGCHSRGPHGAGDTAINTSGVWLSLCTVQCSLCTQQCSACFSLALPGSSWALAHLLLLYL